MNRIPIDALHIYCSRLLGKGGAVGEESYQIAEVLVWAETRGLRSHGVRLVPIYIRRLNMGLVNSPSEARTVASGDCWAVIDSRSSFGPVVGLKAVEDVVRKASKMGIGTVWCRDSTHFGAAGYYAWWIARKGMIGICMANAAANMAPWGASEAALGTNPIAIAAPSGKENPILLDIATSVVAKNTINLAREQGQAIPLGWALDGSGSPTTVAENAVTLMPFGEHKGSGLAIFVEIFCGLLSGGATRKEIGKLFHDMDRPERSCNFFMAIDPEQITGHDLYYSRIAEMAAEIRGLRPAEGVERVMLPGDKEYDYLTRCRTEGVELDPAVVRELLAVGEHLGVPRPAELE